MRPWQLEHYVVVGPDWWTCMCYFGGSCSDQPAADAKRHADQHGAEMASTSWVWDDISDCGPDTADLIQYLWEQDSLTEVTL